MAFNLLQTVTDHLDDGLLGQISGLAGINKNQASSAMGSMLPALIGGLMKKGATNDGAGALLDLITKGGHTGGLLDNLGDILGGDKSKGLMDSGNSLLSSVFGGNMGSIMNILGKVTGLTRGSSGSLMSLLAPIAINFIGKRIKNKALDAVGLKNMLGEQRQYVADGMPAEIGSMLGFASKKTDDVAAAAKATAAAAPKGGGGGFLKLLLPLVVLGGLAWWFMGRGTADSKTATTTEEVTSKATDKMAGKKATTKTTTTTSGNTHTHADGTVHTGDHSHDGDKKMGDASMDAMDGVPEGKMEAKLMVNAAGDLVDEQGKVIFKKGEFTIAEDGTFLDKDGKRIRIFLDKVKDALKGAGDKIKGAGSKIKDGVKGAGEKIKDGAKGAGEMAKEKVGGGK